MGDSLQPLVLLKGLEQVRDSVGPCTFVGPTTSKFSAALVTPDGKGTQLTRVDSSAKCLTQPSYYQIGDVIRLCPAACTARGTSSVVTDTCDLDGVGGSSGAGAGGYAAGGRGGAGGGGRGGTSGTGATLVKPVLEPRVRRCHRWARRTHCPSTTSKTAIAAFSSSGGAPAIGTRSSTPSGWAPASLPHP